MGEKLKVGDDDDDERRRAASLLQRLSSGAHTLAAEELEDILEGREGRGGQTSVTVGRRTRISVTAACSRFRVELKSVKFSRQTPKQCQYLHTQKHCKAVAWL